MSDFGEDTFEPEGPFPPESADAIHGLLSLGYLEKRVSFAGHSFVLRTLKAGEEIAVTLTTKEYAETVGYAKAYAIGVVAASLELVDGAPMMGALGPDMVTPIQQKYAIVSQYFWPVVEFLYKEYLALLEEQIEAFKAFQVKS